MSEDLLQNIHFEENLLLRVFLAEVRFFETLDGHQSVGDFLGGQVDLPERALSNQLDYFVKLETGLVSLVLRREESLNQVRKLSLLRDVLVVQLEELLLEVYFRDYERPRNFEFRSRFFADFELVGDFLDSSGFQQREVLPLLLRREVLDRRLGLVFLVLELLFQVQEVILRHVIIGHFVFGGFVNSFFVD